MVLLDELRVTMSDYRKDLKELYEVLGIEKAQARYDELQKQVADPDFYSDLENSQKVLQEVKSLENRINKYKKMEETLDDILTLIELTMEEGEEESNAELNEEADSFVKELESLKLASLLTGEYDSSNAILTFHAGAGGTEAQDWAEMLYRMYNRWAERHNFKAELLDYLTGEKEPDTKKALATIVARRGSAPRGIGTKMLVLEDGRIIGTIGGGCMESEVQHLCLRMLHEESAQGQIFTVDMTASQAEEEGLVCGGTIQVFMEVI